MRGFNPIAFWTQVAVGNRTVRIIKSIQRGTISFTGTNTVTGTATITSVDTSKAIALATGGSQNTSTGGFATRIDLTNATTVTATTNNDNGAGRTYITGYVVVEFY